MYQCMSLVHWNRLGASRSMCDAWGNAAGSASALEYGMHVSSYGYCGGGGGCGCGCASSACWLLAGWLCSHSHSLTQFNPRADRPLDRPTNSSIKSSTMSWITVLRDRVASSFYNTRMAHLGHEWVAARLSLWSTHHCPRRPAVLHYCYGVK